MDIRNFRNFGKKIICVGRNYKALAAEQGNPIPENPIVFLKPPSSYITVGETIKVPPRCSDMYHEVELGVVIGSRASDVSESNVMDCVAGYALCLDMTAWDLQQAAKRNGHPWSIAKGFDTACPVSSFIAKENITNTSNIRLWLKRNGDMKQDSLTSDMIFTVPEVLCYISQYFTLEPGDLILTGSPAGAGPVSRGDKLEAGLDVDGVALMDMTFLVE